MDRHSKKATISGILIGFGLGGFVDGIVLHQIFQWHNMVSNRIPPDTLNGMKTNMVWDGIFHAAMWLFTLVGILLLRSAAADRETIPSSRQFIGQLILGWGLFNLIEGIIDHHILALHYVRQVPNYTIYNLTFLAIAGVLFSVIGWSLMQTRTREVEN